MLIKLYVILGIFVGIVNGSCKTVGGSAVNYRSEFKYQALIKFDEDDNSFCGGVIISSDLVLSAAHCFDPPYNEVKVIVGNLWVNGDANAVVHYVRKVWVHENYDKATVSNDIALLKLSTHLYFDDNVGNVSWNNQEVAVGTTCFVSGWGVYDPRWASSDDLRAVDVKIVDTKTCDLKHGGAIMEGMLCAGEPGKDACMNDSGGPLVCDGVLVGIVSWGPNNCGDADFPGVYTNVSYFSTWIADVRSSGNSPYLGFITVFLLICLMLVGV